LCKKEFIASQTGTVAALVINHNARTSQETGKAREVTLNYTRDTDAIEIQEWLPARRHDRGRRPRADARLSFSRLTDAGQAVASEFVSGHDDIYEP
jgi:hypothetical protein